MIKILNSTYSSISSTGNDGSVLWGEGEFPTHDGVRVEQLHSTVRVRLLAAHVHDAACTEVARGMGGWFSLNILIFHSKMTKIQGFFFVKAVH